VPEQAATGFGGLLRRLRAEAGLTQEELAEAARLSPRSVSDLERGINQTARKETARLLANALGLTGPDKAEFEAAARGRPVPGGGAHGFPAALTSFVGRAEAMRDVARLLETCRLVTVTGPGGSGKTRLVAEVANKVAGRFADGAWLTELAPVADPAQVASAVAVALGVREQPGEPAAEAVARVLARRQLLVVLDNCEHVIGAAAELSAGLLAACDDVKILATSRWRWPARPGTGWRRWPFRIRMIWRIQPRPRRWRCSPTGPATRIRVSCWTARPCRRWPGW
jgi:transcriptional regulator with XRE-family HTH domain